MLLEALASSIVLVSGSILRRKRHVGPWVSLEVIALRGSSGDPDRLLSRYQADPYHPCFATRLGGVSGGKATQG